MQVPTLTEIALEKLEKLILSGALRPGDRINLDELSRTFSISPTPFREALNRLERERLVIYRPRAGWAVAQVSREEFFQSYEMQELLETAMTARAMDRLDAGDLERLETWNREMRRCHGRGDAQGVIGANLAFHKAIYDRYPNAIMRHTLEQVWKATHLERRWVMIWDTVQCVPRLMEEHDALIRALGQRDEAAVRLVMMQHFRTGEEAFRGYFDRVEELLEEGSETEGPEKDRSPGGVLLRE